MTIEPPTTEFHTATANSTTDSTTSFTDVNRNNDLRRPATLQTRARAGSAATSAAFGNENNFLKPRLQPSSRPTSRTPSLSPSPSSSPLSSRAKGPSSCRTGSSQRTQPQQQQGRKRTSPPPREKDAEWDADDSDTDVENGKYVTMSRPPTRPGDGRSHLPLLNDDDRGRTSYDSAEDSSRRPLSSRRSQMRSRSPSTMAKLATRKKYTYAAFFLALSLVSFVVQTETAVYIQHELKWNKAYCMLYFTHGSWVLLWPVQLFILRLRKRSIPWKSFWRQHVHLLRTTGQMVATQELHPTGRAALRSPVRYLLTRTAFVTSALTIAGSSWYIAVNLTSPSDITAIYNCSAFFAYAFSIPLLKEKLRLDKSLSVILAIIGVLVMAYGDKNPTKHGGKSGGSVGGAPDKEEEEAKNRLAGNLIIGVGSVLYGFYEVLYKKVACPPEGTSPGRGMLFANTFGSLIGAFTLLVLWIPLPVLHYMGWETFEFPRGEAGWMMLISVLANATFSGSFLILISLTSPVISSVAALLTIFLVAIVDWYIPDKNGKHKALAPAAIVGGLIIVAAFLLLSWSTWREMNEEKRQKDEDVISDSSDTDDS